MSKNDVTAHFSGFINVFLIDNTHRKFRELGSLSEHNVKKTKLLCNCNPDDLHILHYKCVLLCPKTLVIH